MFDLATALFILTGLVGLGLIYLPFLSMRSSLNPASLQEIRREIDRSVAEWEAKGRYPDLHLHAAIFLAHTRRLLLIPAIAGGMLVLTSIGGLAFGGLASNRLANSLANENAQISVARVVATRMFAGPGQYPPDQFKAYGIVAFNARQGDDNKDRFNMLCDAYRKVIPHYTETRDVPLRDQMVTVWPIDKDPEADEINRIDRDKICARAVPHYGFVTGLRAIETAKQNGATLSGRGPFLLAWAPGSDMGEPDALVLVADLSNVAISEDAELMFIRWGNEIQEDKSLWDKGWDPGLLRVKVRLWVDKNGKDILDYFKRG